MSHASGSMASGWTVAGFTLERWGRLVVCRLDASFSASSVFAGTYGSVPEGFRPSANTGYMPCAVSNGTTLYPGTVAVNPSGDLYVSSAGVKAVQVVFSGCWLA